MVIPNGWAIKSLLEYCNLLQGLTLDIPRDREGEFELTLIPNGKRDVSGVEEKVLSMWREVKTTLNGQILDYMKL